MEKQAQPWQVPYKAWWTETGVFELADVVYSVSESCFCPALICMHLQVGTRVCVVL